MRSLVQLGKHSYFSLVSCPKTCEEDVRKIGLVQPKLKLTILVNNRNPAQKRSSQNPPKVLLLTWTECFIFPFIFVIICVFQNFLFHRQDRFLNENAPSKWGVGKICLGKHWEETFLYFFRRNYLFKRHWSIFFHVFQRGFPSDLF